MAMKVKQTAPFSESVITAACGGTAKGWIRGWVDADGMLTRPAQAKLDKRANDREIREHLALWLPIVKAGGSATIRGMHVICDVPAAAGFTTDVQAPYDAAIMPGSQASKAGAAFTLAQLMVNGFITIVEDKAPTASKPRATRRRASPATSTKRSK